MKNKKDFAYIIGVALGDGNLSNPNGRAVRLRISCDNKYKNLIENIFFTIKKLFPENKVSIVKWKKNCIDVSCYSNKWERILGWNAKNGSKVKQNVSVPKWIMNEKKYILPCLKGLFQTDGSIYFDRKYKMVNFVTRIPGLANDIMKMINIIGFIANIQKYKSKNGKIKHTIRIAKNSEAFIKSISLNKS